jgi:DNA-binding response OmpR family regulator
MKKICIVEDDFGISTSLKLYLENSDFLVVIYETWKWAFEFITEQKPDLIILDINLPEVDWIEICSLVRGQSSTPIIMLTARWTETDRVTWLEQWADDYISKPFSPRELLARINSILRRIKDDSVHEKILNEHIITLGNIVINSEKNQVYIWDVEISITKNEFDILEKIAKAWGALVSRETLMKEVIWYDNYIYDRTIDTHIKNLRKKLWDKNLILTVRWKWYRLNI